jgi:hypothetical protein
MMSKALEDIAAERRRQVEVEGWTSEHDDEHTCGEMAQAAGVYAIGSLLPGERSRIMNRYWPWDGVWFKPRDARRDLVKAGALIVAEIERLDRAKT